ncbi:unnamed protein product [Rhodiola kirilowii]
MCSSSREFGNSRVLIFWERPETAEVPLRSMPFSTGKIGNFCGH